MSPVVLSAILASTPALTAPPPPPPPPVVADFVAPPPQPTQRSPRVKPEPPPLPPARLALYFAPVSLFSLTFWLEPDLHLAGGVSVFANVGGGPFGQLGGDLGLRYYVGGQPFEGFALDVRASVFSLPGDGLVMLGPGLQLSHNWRIGRLALSVGLGFTTWYRLQPSRGGTLFGTVPTDAEIIVFPGFNQPPGDRPAVQPTIRVSLGPTF